MRCAFVLVGVALATAGCQTSAPAGPTEARRAALEPPEERVVELASLPDLALSPPAVLVEGPWGSEPGAFGRETEAAHTGPMAIAAEPGGGVAVLDTVAGRVQRFDADGRLRAVVPIGVETGDDLVLLPDGGFAVLAYARLPEPHHELLTVGPEGDGRGRVPAPQAATLPTQLLADGARLLVEQRHGWLHAVDGSPRRWGRPAGDLALRVELDQDRAPRLTARDRDGDERWRATVESPWPVTEILALEACDAYVALVLRRIDEVDVGDGERLPTQQTWLVALDRSGAPLGRLELRDSRVTDSGRPFAVAEDGDLLELVTTEVGVTVLRYSYGGA